jgi:hypothetical protein
LCHSAAEVELPMQVRERLDSADGGSTIDGVGVIRQEAKNEGFFACVDVGEGTTGERLLDRLLEFGKTQNLRSLGLLRYVLARRSADTTTLVILWTEGDANLSELFPKYADSPGRDLEGLPRPARGRRLLSAFEQGKPFGFTAYRIDGQSKAAVLARYQAALREQGWRLINAAGTLTVAERDGRKALIQITETRSGTVVVHLSDLG